MSGNKKDGLGDLFLNTRALESYIDITLHNQKNLRKKCKIPYLKIFGFILYEKSIIDKWLEAKNSDQKVILIKKSKNTATREWLSPMQLHLKCCITVNSQKTMRREKKLGFSKAGKFVRYQNQKIEQLLREHVVVTLEEALINPPRS